MKKTIGLIVMSAVLALNAQANEHRYWEAAAETALTTVTSQKIEYVSVTSNAQTVVNDSTMLSFNHCEVSGEVLKTMGRLDQPLAVASCQSLGRDMTLGEYIAGIEKVGGKPLGVNVKRALTDGIATAASVTGATLTTEAAFLAFGTETIAGAWAALGPTGLGAILSWVACVGGAVTFGIRTVHDLTVHRSISKPDLDVVTSSAQTPGISSLVLTKGKFDDFVTDYREFLNQI